MPRKYYLPFLLSLGAVYGAGARTVFYQNFKPADGSALVAAVAAGGDALAPLPKDGPIEPGALVLLGARELTYKPDLPDPLTPRLQEHVNNGGAVVAFATGRNYQLARLS
ncbi:MAG: hypothetical protein LBK60_06355, partial [Verrucomicrobiales bacterium]|nr:hypothetical protein [Verrucomicrobiales bacterium]